VEELSVEEEAAAASLLADMSPDLLNELCDVFNKSASGQEFVDRIMVGDCPQCGNSKTGDCENDPEIENPCVGRCFECGLLWCLDCGEFFKDVQSTEHDCPAWEEMDCDDNDLDETD
jgi:hypothetical protein